MKVRRNLRLSGRALLRHGVRTGLAISGTSIGVAAVVVMVAIGEGAERELLARVEAMGGKLLLVSAGRSPALVGRSTSGGLVTTLTPADADAIGRTADAVERTAASIDANLPVKYGSLTMRTSIRATTPDYELIRGFRALRGRYFTHDEDRDGLRLAVIGARVAATLFDGIEPLGETVRVGSVPFEVIGVLESKGSSANAASDEDNQILIPLRTGLRRVFNADYVMLVYTRVREDAEMGAAADQVAAVLRRRHRPDRAGADDFRIDDQFLVLEAERAAAASFQRLITALASVALLVGGVGILSTMLLSIRERRSEVGLRIAVGAKRRDVRTQFVVEALILGAAGGVTGLAAGLGAALAVGRATRWQTAVSGEAVAIAVGAALTVSLVFGVFPAHRAAALDPIRSLRAE